MLLELVTTKDVTLLMLDSINNIRLADLFAGYLCLQTWLYQKLRVCLYTQEELSEVITHDSHHVFIDRLRIAEKRDSEPTPSRTEYELLKQKTR